MYILNPYVNNKHINRDPTLDIKKVNNANNIFFIGSKTIHKIIFVLFQLNLK